MIYTHNISAIAQLTCYLLALASYGCSIGPAETVTHAYRLNPDISVRRIIAADVRNGPATLLISIPKAQPGFDTPRMAYLRRPHELSYYAFNHWVDTPGRMLLQPLAEAMEATGLWRGVVQAASPVRADYRLDCDSLILEQQFFSPSRVRFALRAQLIDTKRQTVIAARSFEVFELSPSQDAYGGVIAANDASTKLLVELTYWIASVMEDRPERQ